MFPLQWIEMLQLGSGVYFVRVRISSHFFDRPRSGLSDRRGDLSPLSRQRSIVINAAIKNACEQVRRRCVSGKQEMVTRDHSRRRGHSTPWAISIPIPGTQITHVATKMGRFNLRPPRKVSLPLTDSYSRARARPIHIDFALVVVYRRRESSRPQLAGPNRPERRRLRGLYIQDRPGI